MNKRTAKALEKSIEHHKQNLLAETPDDVRLGADFCALCNLFNKYDRPINNTDCIGCPVHKKTGEKYCGGTPYEESRRAFISWYNYYECYECTGKHSQYRRKFRAAEKKEIKFLESLRE